MADNDPRVTDLRRYRKARERARRQPPPRPRSPSQPLLGSRRNAGLILAAVILVAIALWLLPMLPRLL
jgi:hypothetical protein